MKPPDKHLEYFDFKLFLQHDFLRRTRNNPRYSLRAYARNLHMDCSTLSKIIRGKRRLGPKTIVTLGLRLGLNPSEIEKFAAAAKAEPKELVSNEYSQIALDTFYLISEWYHYAILELLRMDHFKPDRAWISRVLGISQAEVNAAIERLIRLKLLTIKPDGQWSDTSGGRTTTLGSHYSTAALRKLQKEFLRLAMEAIDDVPWERRDQTTMTMAIDSSKLENAKKRITKFRRDLASYLSRSSKRDALYNISISLYPLTKEK